MRYLIDTNIFIYVATDKESLSRNVAKILGDYENLIYVSNESLRELIVHYNNKAINFKEFARMTDDFNGAMLKAVCVEAGMIALRRGGAEVTHADYVEGINQVKAKKKAKLYYYS